MNVIAIANTDTRCLYRRILAHEMERQRKCSISSDLQLKILPNSRRCSNIIQIEHLN